MTSDIDDLVKKLRGYDSDVFAIAFHGFLLKEKAKCYVRGFFTGSLTSMVLIYVMKYVVRAFT